jgi:beta-glucosidase
MSDIKLSATEMKNTETVTLSLNLTNNNPTRAGSEVVQLYIRDNVSSVTRPVKELKAFKKISLKGGQQKIVEFEISKKELSFWTIDNVFDAEPGTFNLMVGNSSRDEDLQSIELTLKL